MSKITGCSEKRSLQTGCASQHLRAEWGFAIHRRAAGGMLNLLIFFLMVNRDKKNLDILPCTWPFNGMFMGFYFVKWDLMVFNGF